MKRKSKRAGAYVTSVESDSLSGEFYDISHVSGGFRCECLAYRFARGEVGRKRCKHIEAYLQTDTSVASMAHGDEPRTAPRRAKVGDETFTVQVRRAITFGAIEL